MWGKALRSTRKASTTVVVEIEYLRAGERRWQMTAIAAWTDEFAGVVERIGPRFARAEARGQAAAYLRGLLGRVERKNSWQLAEAAGDASPYGLQQFLYRATWDPD